MDEITTIQISVKTKDGLSKIGKMSDTYDSVISKLIKEHNNLNIQPYLAQLNEYVDFPVKKEMKQFALQLFEGILGLGNDVSFSLETDSKEAPLIDKYRDRKNRIVFYKNKKDLCLVRIVNKTDSSGHIYVYHPTKIQDADSDFLGWKNESFIHNEYVLKNRMEEIKRVYEDM